ncbi:hypothetical protein OS493_014975 [Desmophyllum pertusum]|uniref:Sodefrin-like factor n=1 Tax=Desmophyllum pertusum TaxID=174260 RepID=A0A9X0DA10_9CNID|nr:hypothetical protein OS493_014975 [Desmophyllum pertusum]
MTLNIYLITSVLLLCVVVIPPAFSIRCYRKSCVNDDCFHDVGEVQCQEVDDDRCGTLSFASETADGIKTTVLQLNCTRSSVDCDEAVICASVGTFVMKDFNETLTECSDTCCNTDMCNAPAKKKSTLMKLHGIKKDAEAVKHIKNRLMSRI